MTRRLRIVSIAAATRHLRKAEFKNDRNYMRSWYFSAIWRASNQNVRTGLNLCRPWRTLLSTCKPVPHPHCRLQLTHSILRWMSALAISVYSRLRVYPSIVCFSVKSSAQWCVGASIGRTLLTARQEIKGRRRTFAVCGGGDVDGTFKEMYAAQLSALAALGHRCGEQDDTVSSRFSVEMHYGV